jgi:hypothetical protein
MINLKLKTLLLTIICVLGFAGFGVLLWKYQTETLYALIGVIILMFIRHTYVAIEHLTNK